MVKIDINSDFLVEDKLQGLLALETGEIKDGTTTTYFVKTNNKLYYVEEFIYDIVTRLKAKESIESLKNSVNTKFNKEYSTSNILQLIEHLKYKLLKPEVNKSDNIFFKMDLFNPSIFDRIAQQLKFIFGKRWFITLFCMVITINFIYLFYLDSRQSFMPIYSLQPLEYFCLLLGCILSLVMHEMGHISAAKFFKVKTGMIHFGIYYVFPVFFTNLSEIWTISRKDRLTVNFAGVFFQMIINSFIVGILFFFNPPINAASILVHVVKFNFVIVAYNLNPFLKFDGYWILSDLFKIVNLNEASSNKIKYFFKYMFSRANREGGTASLKASIFLNIYSVFYFIFLVLASAFSAYYLFIGLPLLVKYAANLPYVKASDFTVQIVFQIIFRILTLFMLVLIFSRIIYRNLIITMK
jgi:putative peptide zinc metalloprotease protein